MSLFELLLMFPILLVAADLGNVSFKLLRGEHVGLVGANGEGKSTFLNIVTGHLLPDEAR